MWMNLWLMVDCPGSQSSLPSYNEATEEPAKKKIIPVQSDFESSPSPEDPSSPLPSPPLYHKNRSSFAIIWISPILFGSPHNWWLIGSECPRAQWIWRGMTVERWAALKTRIAQCDGSCVPCVIRLFPFFNTVIAKKKPSCLVHSVLETCHELRWDDAEMLVLSLFSNICRSNNRRAATLCAFMAFVVSTKYFNLSAGTKEEIAGAEAENELQWVFFQNYICQQISIEHDLPCFY